MVFFPRYTIDFLSWARTNFTSCNRQQATIQKQFLALLRRTPWEQVTSRTGMAVALVTSSATQLSLMKQCKHYQHPSQGCHRQTSHPEGLSIINTIHHLLIWGEFNPRERNTCKSCKERKGKQVCLGLSISFCHLLHHQRKTLTRALGIAILCHHHTRCNVQKVCLDCFWIETNIPNILSQTRHSTQRLFQFRSFWWK